MGLIYQASEQGSKMERLEESTKEADVQVAQQTFCIYISYQIDSLGCFSPHLQFVLYWPKQSNLCHCGTNFWATLSLAAGPPGGLLLHREWVQSPQGQSWDVPASL